MDDHKNRPKTFAGQVKQAWLQHQFMILVCFGVRARGAGAPGPNLCRRPHHAPHPTPTPAPPAPAQFGVVLLGVWHFLSDGDFSFLMTLGSLLVLFGFLLLVAKALLTRKLSNVSFKTLQAYALVYAARLTSILFYEGYLPYDKSGDWFYQSVEVSALVVCAALLACIQLRILRYADKADTFDAQLSRLLGLPPWAGVLVLVVPVLLLAAVLHPSLNNNWATDVAWTFALYLEAVAIYPQIYIFSSIKEEVEPLELNFVFFLAVARLLHFVFWVSSYQELNDKTSGSLNRKFRASLSRRALQPLCACGLLAAGSTAYPHRPHTTTPRSPPLPYVALAAGYFVVGSQLVNLALLSDFSINHLAAAREHKGYLPS